MLMSERRDELNCETVAFTSELPLMKGKAAPCDDWCVLSEEQLRKSSGAHVALPQTASPPLGSSDSVDSQVRDTRITYCSACRPSTMKGRRALASRERVGRIEEGEGQRENGRGG